MHAEFLDPPNGIRAVDAALAHHDGVRRYERGQLLRDRKAHLESIEITVVDADHSRASGHRGLELVSAMEFGKHIEGQRLPQFSHFAKKPWFEQCCNQQPGLSAVTFGFE